MPYVWRGRHGQVIAVFAQDPGGERAEFIASDDPDVRQFLSSEKSMLALDLSFVRVVEDVLQVLIDKKQLYITDVPLAARAKYQERVALRQRKRGEP